MTQAALAKACGLSPPDIAAMEDGTRPLGDAMLRQLLVALDARPSVILKARRNEVVAVAARHGATNVRVFGSIARGEDGIDSDVDLLATFRPGTSLYDLAELTEELETLLGTAVDIVADGGLQERHANITREALAL